MKAAPAPAGSVETARGVHTTLEADGEDTRRSADRRAEAGLALPDSAPTADARIAWLERRVVRQVGHRIHPWWRSSRV
jgi:hypothetical protein